MNINENDLILILADINCSIDNCLLAKKHYFFGFLNTSLSHLDYVKDKLNKLLKKIGE